MSPARERIERLRRVLERLGLTHLLVPSADEHLNEYLPPWRERRQWASGFTGSAGDLLVALDPAETLLFTDGRYHLQAEEQLAGSGITVQRVGAPGVKPLAAKLEELAERHGARMVLGGDPMVSSVEAAEALQRSLTRHGARLVTLDKNPVDALWEDRPAPPVTALLECPLEWTGAAAADKVARLRQDLAQAGADAIAVVRLDQIAWLLNLRSLDDVPYNPVFESFLWVDASSCRLFLHEPARRLPAGFSAALPGFEAGEYGEFLGFLAGHAKGRVLVDPERTTLGVQQALRAGGGVSLVRGTSPIENAKAVKNEVELRCMARANLLASAAKTAALLWLSREVEAGRRVTERSFQEHLEGRYAALPGYRALSFRTISATGGHGAIVHYGAADDTPLQAGDLFLIDSGVQLDGGTTDDTRTVAVGTPGPEQRIAYTRVLKAHVAGARQVFPENTPGAAIDAIVRAPLWAEGLHYDHGTGHGVGAFLNVHEGPFGIAESSRRSAVAVGIPGGVVTSIEPGFYRADFGGIRLENLYATARAEGLGGNGRGWIRFAPLTFIPFDPALIDRDLLDPAEIAWIDAYHAQVLERLAALLDRDDFAQLRQLLA